MKSKLFAIGLVCGVVFLYFWFLTPYSQATERPIDQLLNSPSIPSDAAHSLSSTNTITFTFYLPIILQPPIELHGYVTENGQPAQDISVTLSSRFPHPAAFDELGTTKTDSNGLYNFVGVPSIACNSYPYCWEYYIEYYDPSAPPGRLMFWETASITNYVQGTAQQFPTFDIGAPVLISPHQGDVVSPTVTFTWAARPLPEDNYGIYLYPLTAPYYPVRIDNLGYISAFTMTLVGDNCNGPCSAYYDRPLEWSIWIDYTISLGYGYTHPTGVFTVTVP